MIFLLSGLLTIPLTFIAIGATYGKSLSLTFEPPDLQYAIFTNHWSGRPRDRFKRLLVICAMRHIIITFKLPWLVVTEVINTTVKDESFDDFIRGNISFCITYHAWITIKLCIMRWLWTIFFFSVTFLCFLCRASLSWWIWLKSQRNQRNQRPPS